MLLIQSMEFVVDVTLRRKGLLRWRLDTRKEKHNLYRCDKCNTFVTIYNDYPVSECNCAPCRECGEAVGSKKHLVPSVPSVLAAGSLGTVLGALSGLQGYSTSKWKSPATHYYHPDRREGKR